MVRPLLLLDLDGVLNPTGSSTPPGYRRIVTDEFAVLLKADHGPWIRELAEVFELTWATTWNRRAQVVFGPLLDLPAIDVLELGPLARTGTRKLPQVRAFVGSRPVAWVDDELFDDAQEWARARSEPTLLVRPSPGVGLTREHVAELLEFAART